jgi:outer membrane immunogenic protein
MRHFHCATLAAFAVISLSSVASAADLPVKAPVYKAPVYKAPVVAPYIWTGFYAGANIGYSWGNANGNISDPSLTLFGLPGSFPISLKPDGLIGGGQIGYNWQANNTWVFGLEADFQGSAEKDSTSFSDPWAAPNSPYTGTLAQTIEAKILWFGTVRGRVGVLVTPTILLYGTGGLAYGGTSVSGSGIVAGAITGTSYTLSNSKTSVGWTLGAGVEGAIPNTSNWTWKLEYLYLDLGSQSGSGMDAVFSTNYTWNVKFTDNIVRVGVNYRF